MQNKFRIISLLMVIVCVLSVFSACNGGGTETQAETQKETSAGGVEPTVRDFVAELKLDMSSDTLKQEVTVKNYVDGDTTHFNVPTSVEKSGVLKARYLAINTPESTGKIEPYGKKASNFTKERLMSATSIIIESDNDKWNHDSTSSGRYLVWVWYKTADSNEYKNLNVEILQNGLAIASSASGNRYGSVCVAAIEQARAQKLYVYSGERDPDMFYGEAVELTLKELRLHIEDYNGIKVAFEGVIVKNHDGTAYVEAYDEETGLYYGIPVYYGYGLSGAGLEVLASGNLSRIVGTVQYYETGGTWQISGVSYQMMNPSNPDNIQKISDGHEPAYILTDPALLGSGKVAVEVTDNEVKQLDYAEVVLGSSIRMENLVVKQVKTTSDPDSNSFGAMTLICEAEDGTVIDVRTIPLYDGDRKLITGSAYLGKTIHVRGLVDCFDGDYQIKVFSQNDITVLP